MNRRIAQLCALGAVMAGTLVTVPTASGAATIASVTADNHLVTANWSLPGGEEVFRVDLASNSGFPEDDGQSELPDPAAESVTFRFPVAGGTYYARVLTCTTAGPGCPTIESNIVAVSVPSDAATLQSVSLTGGVFSASWTLPDGVDPLGIEIASFPERSIRGFTAVVFDDLLLPGETSYATPLSLSPGVYYVHIETTPTPETCYTVVNSCAFEYSNIGAFRVSSPLPGGGSGTPGTNKTAADKTVALGAVTAAARQDVDKLSLTLNLGEAAKVKLSGSVNVPGASKVYRFKTVNKAVGAGKQTKLSLKLSSTAKRAVKRALRRKKRLKAKLTLVVTDNAGNAQTKKYSVRLKR